MNPTPEIHPSSRAPVTHSEELVAQIEARAREMAAEHQISFPLVQMFMLEGALIATKVERYRDPVKI